MKKLTKMAIVLSLFITGGCAIIMGRDDESALQRVPIRFVETLRNESSLRGESLKESRLKGDVATTLQQPKNLFADSFRVYVTDSAPTRIFVFDRTERKVSILDSIPPPAEDEVKLIDPAGIAVDAAGTLWVSDAQQGKVFGYTPNGKLLFIIGQMGGLGKPGGLVADRVRSRLYVADTSAHKIKLYSMNGVELSEISISGKTIEGFKSPGSLALDKNGNLFVLDTSHRRVQKYSAEGAYVKTIKLRETSEEIATLKPKCIAVDSSGHLYVTDSISNNILVFGQEGEFLFTWGRTGTMNGDFWTPYSIFIDDRDFIYIADQSNGRVQVFQYMK